MTTITPTFDAKLDQLVREKLVTARIGLLLKAPFFGNLATRLELVNADDWCQTAATDGRRFYYNTKFVNSLNTKQLEFLFGHETLHIVFDHFTRRVDRDPKIWNIANDFVVNDTLIQERIGEKITQVQICYDPKYSGKASEEVYDELMKNANQVKVKMNTLDEHIDFTQDGDQDGDGDGDGDQDSNKPGKGRGRPMLTPEEAKAIRDEVKEAVISAAKSAGNVPGNIKRMIEGLTEPKIHWRDLLPQVIQSTIKNDFTMRRPNKKSQQMRCVLPSMLNEDTIDICIAIDMSGSIGQEQAKDFLSEIWGIMNQYNCFNIHLWCFDTQVYAEEKFTQDNKDDMLNYVPQGGGGTMFECNWEYMKENGIQPKFFLMFTDGYPCGSWGEENYCDTMFLIHGPESIKPPWGLWVHYEK